MIDLLILRSQAEPVFYSLSIAYGNAHVVIRLASPEIISRMMSLISRHQGETGADWIEIGTFGNHPATLYLDKETVKIIVDGDDCGDGSAQSFGLHLPVDTGAEFVRILASETRKHDIEFE